MAQQGSMSETLVGTSGEAAVLSALARHGIPCYIPFGDGHTADLIAEIGGSPKRIQVKSCGSDTATVRFQLAKRRRQGWTPYDDIDYFALYASHYHRVMLIPFEKGKNRINIRFAESQRSRLADIRVDDVDIDKILEEIEHGVQEPD